MLQKLITLNIEREFVKNEAIAIFLKLTYL